MQRKNLIRRDPTVTDVPDHLGGGRDRCHFDPTVLTYLRDTFNVKTMLDVGCGLGCTVMAARELGIDAHGIDGDESCAPDIPWDFTRGKFSPPLFERDLVWSMEFLEHVDAEFIPNYMPVFQVGRYAFVTFAPPGKEGHHHVNCQPEEYWIELFQQNGFTWLRDETYHIRKISNIQTVEPDGVVRKNSRKRFIKDYGLLFKRA